MNVVKLAVVFCMIVFPLFIMDAAFTPSGAECNRFCGSIKKKAQVAVNEHYQKIINELITKSNDLAGQLGRLDTSCEDEEEKRIDEATRVEKDLERQEQQNATLTGQVTECKVLLDDVKRNLTCASPSPFLHT